MRNSGGDGIFHYPHGFGIIYTFHLEEIGKELGSQGPEHAHKSVDDAEATMNTVKAMCSALEITLSDLISLCPDSVGKAENGNVWTPVRERAEIKRKEAFDKMIRENRIEHGAAKKFIRFRNAVKINRQSKSSFSGKKFVSAEIMRTDI